ncbi:MAG: PD-(D/E)XK nuclease family protein [Phycisphaerae bacterium]
MAFRFILGRAGTGKTHHCLGQLRAALGRDAVSGPAQVLLVPEQAALQMERGLLADGRLAGLSRGCVLSFRRLAHRVLTEAPGPLPTPLTVNGRRMLLRSILARRRGELREFSAVAAQGVVREFDAAVAELVEQAAAPAALWSAVRQAEEAADPSAATARRDAGLRGLSPRLAEGASTPATCWRLAADRLGEAAWLRGAAVWVDGFAGFTEQQLGLLARAGGDGGDDGHLAAGRSGPLGGARDDVPPDELSIFARTERSGLAVRAALVGAGVAEHPPLLLHEPPRRFASAELRQLEQRLFATSPGPSGELTRGGATVRIVAAPTARDEVAAVLRELLRLARRPESPLRFSEMAIIVRDLEPYHDVISAALREHGVPYFIDRRRPTSHHAVIELVRAALRMRCDPPAAGRFVPALVKTGLLPLEGAAADLLDNYLRSYGLADFTDWRREWNYPAYGPIDDDRTAPAGAVAALQVVNATRRRLHGWLHEWVIAAHGTAGPTCGEHVTALAALLRRLETSQRLAAWADAASSRGDLDEAQEHEQVWADLVRLLDELHAALADEPMTAIEFAEVVEAGLGDFTLGLVPATLNQLLVSSIERSRHPPLRAAFLLGFSDGLFPLRHAEEALLGDAERARLESAGLTLGPSRRTRQLDERLLAYVAMTRASEQLWISYPQSDDAGRPRAPSPYLAHVSAALRGLPVDASPSPGGPLDAVQTPAQLAAALAPRLRQWCEGSLSGADADAWLAAYERARGDARTRPALARAVRGLLPARQPALSRGVVKALRGAELDASISRLERFAACPYQHFALHDLRLSAPPAASVAPRRIGSMYHRMLEQFVAGLIARNQSLTALSEGQVVAELSGIAQQAVAWVAQSQPLSAGEERQLLRRSTGDLAVALHAQRSLAEVLAPRAAELAFGASDGAGLPAIAVRTPGGRTLRLHGRLDRVDLTLSGEAKPLGVVFDYKRAEQRGLRLDAVFHGLALQLAGYLVVLSEARRTGHWEVNPAGAFYLPLAADFLRVTHPAERENDPAWEEFKPRGLVEFDALLRLDPGPATTGWGRRFAYFRSADHTLGHEERGDAASREDFRALLAHVRARMGELADRLMDGCIDVSPARIGAGALPCERCEFRDVCRFEPESGFARTLPRLSRRDVFVRVRDASPPEGTP